MTATARYTRSVIEERGWTPGSTLEDRFVLRLHRLGVRPAHLVQQHPVGAYRIDFADPDVLIGIEADGFFHRMPGALERDRERDAWLLTQGWYLIRISDNGDDAELEQRLCCAVLLIREERTHQGRPWLRDPAARKKAEPSRLAIVAGHRRA